MKRLLVTLFFLSGLSVATMAQSEYDEKLAKELGADQYGMKKYVIAFLYRGDKVADYSDEERSKLQQGHMANINRMAEDGKLVMAGPFFGNEDLRGLYIFDVQSIEEAKSLTETDPSIQAGVLKMDLKEWYGSAALMQMNELHMKVAKEII
ncbi:YciI family protein [Algoriphagus machipongonensis]|uniref:YCII domain protein n=1 Tax=Algoriphagus machipongonensis TaxID=388413 RepID=A3I1C3_9BACT|nr:YciI family protein [Algoriphagus machipongonensis]EAZ79589.2 YCII domain protein [Algoriphagus machipongonensis]